MHDGSVYLTLERVQAHAMGEVDLCWRLEVIGVRRADLATTRLHPSNAGHVLRTLAACPGAQQIGDVLYIPLDLAE